MPDRLTPVQCLKDVCLVAMQPPESQQLFKNNTLLDDAKRLADLKIENDDVIALTLMQAGKPAFIRQANTVSDALPQRLLY